ncbi:flavodoxin family protein [bacterium]|nr:flavodoxin family protein [bacterium]
MKQNARKKLLAICFSPRKKSNSSRLLDIALQKAENENIEIIRYNLSEFRIDPCNACEICYDGSPCPIRDDMTPIYEHLATANGLFISTPVYFYNVPACAKALIDRCQVFWARKYLLAERLPTRPCAIIEIAASGGNRVFDGINLTIKYFLDSISIYMPKPLALRHIDCIQEDLSTEALNSASVYGEAFLSRFITKE